MDGFQLVNRKNHTCTPVIFINLNLPPNERYRMSNVILSLIIPGPKKEKDLDSFLFPLVEEMDKLHEGISEVCDASMNYNITLKAWLILCTGDGPATASAMGTKIPGNAIAPCHMCEIKAKTAKLRVPVLDANKNPIRDAEGNILTKDQDRATYYIPHTDEEINNPVLRTNLQRQILQSNDLSAKVCKELGITRISILIRLKSKSLHFPRSFPTDVMHCIFSNNVKTLAELWMGLKLPIDKAGSGYKNPSNMPTYRIPDTTLRLIGEEIVATRPMFPSALGHALRSPIVHINGFSAAEWKMYLNYVVPTMYNRYQGEQYMENFRCLARIYRLAAKHCITEEEILQLADLCREFVRTYQECYFRGEPERIAVMGINIHVILHIRM